jgi:glycine C-acetyltransferase
MYGKLKAFSEELQTIEDNGILKRKNHYFTTKGEITISTGETVLNFVLIIIRIIITSRGGSSGKRYLDTHGFGMSSVRFICGTQDIHKLREKDF